MLDPRQTLTHVNVFHFIEALQDEEKYSAAQRQLLDAGERVQQKKNEYIRNDERLSRVCRQFEEYLREEEEDDDDNDPWQKGFLKFMKTIGLSARGPWLEA